MNLRQELVNKIKHRIELTQKCSIDTFTKFSGSRNLGQPLGMVEPVVIVDILYFY